MYVSTYDDQRARLTFLHDSFLGGEHYRTPTRTTLSSARVRSYREGIDEAGNPTGKLSEQVRDYCTYLVPFPAESPESFEIRLALASLVNPCETIIDAYSEGVTAYVRRTLGSLEPYLVDVDRQGSTWGGFVEEAVRWALVYGVVAVVVDAPRANPARNRAEELASGVQPYCVLVHPTAWAWTVQDCDGRLVEFAYVEDAFEDTEAAGFSQQRKVRVRVWKLTGWEIYEGSVLATQGLGAQRGSLTKVDEGPAPAVLNGERLPIELLYYKRLAESRKPRGQSLISNAADLTRAIYNKRSCEEQIAREAGFPTLAIPMAKLGGQMDPGTRVAIGPGKAIGYDSNTGAPQWIQPSSEWAKDLRESWWEDFHHALRSAGLELATDNSAQVQSGEALRIRSRDYESKAKRFGGNCRRFELKTLALFALLAGEPEDTATVTYPTRYTLPDLSASLDNALRIMEKGERTFGPTAIKLARMQAIDAAMPLSDVDRSTVSDEIDEALEKDLSERDDEGKVASLERAKKARDLTPPPEEHEAEAAAPAPEADTVTKPTQAEAAKLFQYHLTMGVVTMNEARAALGMDLPPYSDGAIPVPEWLEKHGIRPDGLPSDAVGASEPAAPAAVE